MPRKHAPILGAALALGFSAAAMAQSPSDPPPPTAAPVLSAMPFMQVAGESDVYEITSSQIAVQRAQDSKVRDFASMLIGHHTFTTNTMLTQAKAAGLQPPPAVLGQGTRAKIDQLLAAGPADFDRIYIQQQVPAHEEALAVMSAYADGGDKAPLRTAAKGAVPIITQHLEHARMLQAGR